MTDKSIRVKLVTVSFLEYNLNKQISLFNFCCFNSTPKVNVDENFHLRLNLAQPRVFLSLQFR